ncbi:MAG: hypothetical protein ACPHJ3_15150, partial [Rubripirellula sp.]
ANSTPGKFNADTLQSVALKHHCNCHPPLSRLFHFPFQFADATTLNGFMAYAPAPAPDLSRTIIDSSSTCVSYQNRLGK